LDHIPALILEISEYLRQPEEGAIAANTAILEKARELGALRHGQRASLHQVLREYQLLNGVLVAFVLEEIDRLTETPPPSACVLLVSRLNLSVAGLSQRPGGALSPSPPQRSPIRMSGWSSSREWRRMNGVSRWARCSSASASCVDPIWIRGARSARGQRSSGAFNIWWSCRARST